MSVVGTIPYNSLFLEHCMTVVKSFFGFALPRIEQPVRLVIIVIIYWLTSFRNKVYLGGGCKEAHAMICQLLNRIKSEFSIDYLIRASACCAVLANTLYGNK